MDRKKLIYIGIILIVTVLVSVTYFSYAFFTNTSEQHGKLNVVVGTLDYKIKSEDLTNNAITLAAGESKEIEIKITSLNSINSKYELYYTTTNDSVQVGYSSNTTDNPAGTINANQYKTIKVIIKNRTSSSGTITFGVQGGFTGKTLTLAQGNSINLLNTDRIVTLYSAASDQIYYYPNNDTTTTPINLGTTDTTGKLENVTVNEEIVYYSTVAKDPNNLSNPFSKRFDNLNDTAYLMPDGEILYWYGYEPITIKAYPYRENGANNQGHSPSIIRNTNSLRATQTNSGSTSYYIGVISTNQAYNFNLYQKIRTVVKEAKVYSSSTYINHIYLSTTLNLKDNYTKLTSHTDILNAPKGSNASILIPTVAEIDISSYSDTAQILFRVMNYNTSNATYIEISSLWLE